VGFLQILELSLFYKNPMNKLYKILYTLNIVTAAVESHPPPTYTHTKKQILQEFSGILFGPQITLPNYFNLAYFTSQNF